MSFRFDTPLIADAFNFGNRGLGLLGSEIASTGTNGPGYVYSDLVLPADANKEYRGYVIAPPGVGTFFAYEDTSFTYSGPSTSFTYRLYEDGVDLGTQVVTINMLAPSVSATWTEANDVFNLSASSDSTTVGVTLGWTEANDIAAISANSAIATVTSTLGWTEQSDICSIQAIRVIPPVIGVSWTEANDTFVVAVNSGAVDLTIPEYIISGAGSYNPTVKTLVATGNTITYRANAFQHMLMYNSSGSPVTVNVVGSAAGQIPIPGTAGNTFNAAIGYDVVIPANGMSVLYLDSISTYLGGVVGLTVTTPFVVIATIIKPA